jgi:hypothetical protein
VTNYCSPPKRFHPAGEVEIASFSLEPPLFTKNTKVTGKRADGIRYETKAQEHILFERPDTYVPSPWFRFRSKGQEKFYFCQPDGIDFDIERGRLTIIEIKLQHTPNAWWQTRRLYEPVLKKLFPEVLWEFAIIEVVRWFDPDKAFPERYNFLKDLSFDTIKPGEFHLHIWNGR